MIQACYPVPGTKLAGQKQHLIEPLHTPGQHVIISNPRSGPEQAGCLQVPARVSVPPRPSKRQGPKPSKQLSSPELPVIHSGSTVDNFRAVLQAIDLDECEENGENAFYVCDLAVVYRLYLRWQRALGGRVEPFFAVKCNPDPHVLNLLAKLGLGFDCASHAEIASILALGVSPTQIIYANPCKAGSFIRHAHAAGVELMTFDNADELAKVAKHHPRAKMVLRILIDDRGSLCRFGEKFGAPLEHVAGLLEAAVKLAVDVVGVAFHVGSGCTEAARYTAAVRDAKWVFELAAQFGFAFKLLDVGGGFGDDNFEILAEGLLAGLDECFPPGCGVRVIAEPGRYFVTEAFELATNIIARRQASAVAAVKSTTDSHSVMDIKEAEEAPVTMYYINDGVYGAFNCIIFDHRVVHPKILSLSGKLCTETLSKRLTGPSDDGEPEPESGASFASLELETCKIFGPSCDSIDLVCPRARLPTKALKVGDWLRWTRMGAYSICAASQFNGFEISQVRYTIDSKGDQALEDQLRLILGCVL
ncbi:hypothetical protein CROQUDRAFT_657509 [Cronartium quercuum f. sp. fusiforme G11]|uniref:ornithine decarboxylase n=1 Tax=Cronartium quercuum f. sp. fusiforme G11 TaxID=708437 RepID=A0A9P6NMR7_9BASI|nr:hypothetical protein CROQUDRAFT_657509 [Cronartium quercuum f. sp. fusiforme G11]